MDRGGAEAFIMNVYRVIDRSQIQFDFLVHEQRECDYDTEIENLGGRIFHIQRLLGPNYLSYTRECRSFFAAHHNYCAVHVHIGSCAHIVINEAHRYGLFSIAHSHSTDASVSLTDALFKIATFSTRFLADYFLACSEQAGVARFGKSVVSSDRFRVLNNGIDTERYRFNLTSRKATRDELGIDDSTIVLCHVGRFAKEKNHRYLIDVFNKWIQTMPKSILVLVGRGPLEMDIRQKVESLGLGDKVYFLGVRSDVPGILMAADLFLFPSIFEGIPIALIEAQATGLPCIISDAISGNARLLPSTICLPIGLDPNKWSELGTQLLTSQQSNNRQDCSSSVRECGFDIRDTALELIRLYSTHQLIGD